MFRFLDYEFDVENYEACFRYENEGIEFTECIKFVKTDKIIDENLLNRALFLSFILIGTSYYKAAPKKTVDLGNFQLDNFQANFFSTVYQEGLSQFAYENNLAREDLAHFSATATATATTATTATPISLNPADYDGVLSLQSGGKDSLLTAILFSDKNPTFWHLGSSVNYPKILDEVAENGELQIATRKIDLKNLAKINGLNGHVPITYIVQSLALIQAILNHNRIVLTSVGHEGAEPHTYIDDLPVNHQWSKTYEAEKLFADYVHRYISPDLTIGSPLRKYSELKIAELFAKNCFEKYGDKFSSCNVTNYYQKADNKKLGWCGNCAKCANSYLLFSPFIEREKLDAIIGYKIGKSLFENSNLHDDFKGLLGVGNYMKPFECVGEIDELRQAYHKKREGYPDLPFEVPEPKKDYDYEKIYESQDLWKNN